MAFIIEPERKIPVYTKTDVVVCGGGAAGLGAAVSAARSGANTLLIESNNALGGDASIAGSAVLYKSDSPKGIVRELIDRMVAEQGAIPDFPIGPAKEIKQTVLYEPEVFKQVALELCEESGVKLLLYTNFASPIIEDKEVKGVFIENKSGRQAVLSDIVIDCTGDADVAARAGVPCLKGRESDSKTRPVTLYFRVGNVDFAAFKKFAEQNSDQVPGGGKTIDNDRGAILLNGFHKLIGDSVKKGELDPYLAYYVRFDNLTIGNSCRVNTTRVYDVDPTDGEDLTRAEIRCRKQIQSLMSLFRKNIPGFESAIVLETSAHIGVRESRHIVGEYALSTEDFDKKFDDAILSNSCLWKPGFDMIGPDGPSDELSQMVSPPAMMKRYQYQIPYRCLIPKNVERLLVAGRCISVADFMRWETRNIESCFYLGQVAGLAAAMCTENEILPRHLDVKKLQTKLVNIGL